MDPTEARRKTAIEIGGIDQIKERVRDVRSGVLVETLVKDLRFGARLLARNPGFTTIAVLAMTLGIGATTASFSVVYAVLLRPLPFPEPDRLAMICLSFAPQNNPMGNMSVADFLDWRGDNHAFEDPVAMTNRRFDLTGTSEPEQVYGSMVTSGFFSMFRARPLVGRTFEPADDRPASGLMVVVSESLWRRRFQGDPAAVGKAVRLNPGLRDSSREGVEDLGARIQTHRGLITTSFPVVHPGSVLGLYGSVYVQKGTRPFPDFKGGTSQFTPLSDRLERAGVRVYRTICYPLAGSLMWRKHRFKLPSGPGAWDFKLGTEGTMEDVLRSVRDSECFYFDLAIAIYRRRTVFISIQLNHLCSTTQI